MAGGPPQSMSPSVRPLRPRGPTHLDFGQQPHDGEGPHDALLQVWVGVLPRRVPVHNPEEGAGQGGGVRIELPLGPHAIHQKPRDGGGEGPHDGGAGGRLDGLDSLRKIIDAGASPFGAVLQRYGGVGLGSNGRGPVQTCH